MSRTARLVMVAALVAACSQDSADPGATLALSVAGAERNTIVVNPNANGNGVAATIQEGIDRVASGGNVLVMPGVYAEALVINKGLTLEGIGDGSGAVVIAPTGTVLHAVDVATTAPVTIRDLTLRYTATDGIHGLGAVDVTVENVSVIALNQPGAGNLITATQDVADGSRARLVVRNSFLDGGINDGTPPLPQLFGLRAQGDVDARFENNVIQRVGGACIFAFTRFDLGGAVNAEILNNELDQCHPSGRVAGILVGPAAGNLPTPTRPVTATGVVNIIGNRIRNSSASCLPASAIAFEVGSGRIENNHITSYVQSCAIPTGRNLQGAVFLGRRQHPLFPAVNVSVRFNDITGNAYAGLRVGANQSVVIDASCNYWGASDGPSGAGSGGGDAVVVEAGAAAPTFLPFATAAIAGTGATSCE
jgi:hypothetical protein